MSRSITPSFAELAHLRDYNRSPIPFRGPSPGGHHASWAPIPHPQPRIQSSQGQGSPGWSCPASASTSAPAATSNLSFQSIPNSDQAQFFSSSVTLGGSRTFQQVQVEQQQQFQHQCESYDYDYFDLQPCFDAEFVYPAEPEPKTKRFEPSQTSQQKKQQSFTTKTNSVTSKSTPIPIPIAPVKQQPPQLQNIQQSWLAQEQYQNQSFQSQGGQIVEDEGRLVEFQASILDLQDERERMQIKTFTNWINSYLSKHSPNLQISNLLEDLKDGVKLITLLRIISGERLPIEKGRRRHHFLCNYNTVLQFLEEKQIKLVNINTCDLVDGRPPVILGLLWTIILHFQIEEHVKSLSPPSTPPERAPPKDNAKHALLQWVQGIFAQNRVPLQVNNFGSNWTDGLALSYLVHCMKPGLVDLEGLQNASNQGRISSAFKVAESGLGIPAILDPSDVDVSSPDEKSVMMYVAQFLHWYNQPPAEEPEPEQEPELSPYFVTPEPEPVPEPELSPLLVTPEPEVHESQPEEFLTPPEEEEAPPPQQEESKEQSAYQFELNEVEKWFLQTSAELAQANSVCPESLSQAKEQLQKDSCLLEKIQDYSLVLEKLADRGFELIGLQPSLNELVTKQLKHIKDRYDSLLQTGNEIGQRHADFCEKFLEYENVLQSVSDKLTQIDGDIQQVPEGTEVELGVGSLEGLKDKLQGEKIRLDLASQVCQAATASLSMERGSAPLVSEKEVQTRAYMAELLGKLQDKMKLLHSAQAQLDAAKHEKDGIMDWLKQAGLALERINSQPIPLSPEKAGMEKAQLESLLNDIRGTKQACVDKLELTGPLDKLEGEADSVLKNRQHLHNDILGLLALLQNAEGWLGGMESTGGELLKSGAAGVEKLHRLLTELEQVGTPKLAEIDEKLKGLISLLDSQDKILVEGQVDGLGKRLAELKRKLLAEQNILETSQKGLQALLRELNEFNCESENMQMAIAKSKPGYLVATAEPVLFAVQASLKECEGRKIKVMQMQQKLASLQNQVEANEMGQASQLLESAGKEQEYLHEQLNSYLTYLRDGVGLRKKFEDEVNFIRYFINRVVGHISTRHFPFHSTQLKPLLEGLGQLENELLETRKTAGEEMKSETGMLLNDCDDLQGMELNKLISELDLDGVLEQLKTYKEFLAGCSGERKWFEDEYELVWNGIKEVQKFIQGSNQKGQAAEGKGHWEEELAGCMAHLAECEALNGKVQLITERGTALFPSLIEKDHPALQAKLKELTLQLSNAGDGLQLKMGLAREGLKNSEFVGAIVDETRQFLDSLKGKLDALKSPIGFGIEDSEGRLSEYEAVLECLKTYRKKLDDQAVPELQSNPDLQRLMAEQDSLVEEVEAEIAKLKRLLNLQQQFLSLVMEVTNFIVKFADIPKEIEKGGEVIDEKIKGYSDALGAIKGCEGLLVRVDEQAGLIVKEEIIKEDERRAIVEQVRSLKSQLGVLKKTVEDKRADHLKTAELYRKYLAELEVLLKRLGESEKEIESTPILERPATSVEAELARHEKLRNELEQGLGQVGGICKELKHEDSRSLPPDLGEKLGLGQLMLERIPGKIKDRKDYLMLQLSLRNSLGNDMEGIWAWVKEYKTKLAGREGGIDFDSVEAVAELHSQDFGRTPKKFIQDAITGVGELVKKVVPSLNDVDQDNLRKEQQCLCEAVQNIFNTAQTIQARLEQGRSIYKTFQDLANLVEGSLAQSQVQEEPITNLLSLTRNLAAVQQAFENLQKEQPQLDSLKEWACSAESLAAPESKSKIQSQIKLVDSRWAESLNGLETRKENLSKLGMDWERFTELCGKFEAELASIEQRFSQVNPFTRNMEGLQEAEVALNKILSDGKGLEGPRNELIQAFQKLERFKDIQVGGLKPRMDQLSSQFSNVLSLLENKLELIVNQGKYLDWIEKEAERVRTVLTNLEGDIQRLDPFQKEYSILDSSISNFDKKLKDVGKEIANLNSQIKDKFTSWKQIMPSSVSLTCGNLECRHDEVNLHLDAAKKNIKQARTLIAEFERDVQTLKSWTFSAESQLEQTHLDEPTSQKKVIQNLLSELPGALYQLERAAKAGTTIAAKIQNPKESQIYKAVVEETEEHILKLKGALEEHKLKVDECLEFWQRFMELYAQVMEWVSEQNGLLKEPVKLTCLEETHQKLDNYLSAVQGMKGVTKRLSQMSKEAASVGELPCVSILYKKLDEAEQAKTDVGGQLLENSSLLQEAVDEWEQFEKKLKDAQSWLKKSRQSLDQSAAAGPTKIRPNREKLLTGVRVQRTKIGMALEKLQVHLKAGLGGNTNVEAEQKQVDRKLESFGNEVKALELSLSSVDS